MLRASNVVATSAARASTRLTKLTSSSPIPSSQKGLKSLTADRSAGGGGRARDVREREGDRKEKEIKSKRER
jgi:hypothetical protein